MKVRARQALAATVTLSYLATGFDWQADYVAVLSPDERSLQLQAWLTLASTDDTSFVGATTQAVAGRVNQERVYVPPPSAPQLQLECWPAATTSSMIGADGGSYSSADPFPIPPPPPPPPPPSMALARGNIVVTGSRIMAERERLGDLQLYRIPEPVTVAANAQKQVGLLDQPAVKVEAIYRMRFTAGDADEQQPGELVLRSRNRPDQGLGLPLPAGNVVLFRTSADRPLLIGEGAMRDTAVGEKVELAVGQSSGVRANLSSGGEDRRTLTVTNDRTIAVRVEVELSKADDERIEAATLAKRDGKLLWLVTVPANGSAIAVLSGPALVDRPVDRARTMLLVQRDEGEQPLGDLDLAIAAIAIGDDFDPDRHAGPPDPLDVGVDADQVAQLDRRDEFHPLDRHGRDGTLRPSRRDDAGGNIHLAQHPAAEDVAVGVDVARTRRHAQGRLAGIVGGQSSSLSMRVSSGDPMRFLVMARTRTDEDQAHQRGAEQHAEAGAERGRDQHVDLDVRFARPPRSRSPPPPQGSRRGSSSA